MLPASDFFRRNVVLSFQEDAIGIHLRDVIDPNNIIWDAMMMWGSDYPAQRGDGSPIAEILAEILAGVPDEEGSPPATPPACTSLTRRGWPSLLEGIKKNLGRVLSCVVDYCGFSRNKSQDVDHD
jgi:hypothetical protein